MTGGTATHALIAFAAVAPATVTTLTAAPRWQQRGIPLPVPPRVMVSVQVMIALLVGAGAAIAGLPWAAVAAVVTWTAVIVVAVATDITTRKAPKELFWGTGFVAAVCLIVQLTADPGMLLLVALGNATALIAATVAWLLAPSLIGFSDIRYFGFTWLTFAAWMPPIASAAAVLLALLAVLVGKLLAGGQWHAHWPLIPFLAAAQVVVATVVLIAEIPLA